MRTNYNCWRQARLDHAAALSRAPTVIREFTARQASPDTDLAAARAVIDTGVRTYGYAGAYLLTPDGQRVIATGSQADAPVAAMKATVTAALAGNAAVMGEFFRGEDGSVYVDAASALRDPLGRPIGVVVLRTDAQKLLFPMLQTWPTPSPTAESVLVRREGDEVVFLNEMRHREGSALTIREPITRTDITTVRAVLGTVGPTEGLDYRGVEVLADLRPVPNSDWFLVAKLDADEVWAEARYRAGVAVILITLLILGGAGGAVGDLVDDGRRDSRGRRRGRRGVLRTHRRCSAVDARRADVCRGRGQPRGHVADWIAGRRPVGIAALAAAPRPPRPVPPPHREDVAQHIDDIADTVDRAAGVIDAGHRHLDNPQVQPAGQE